MALVLSSRRGDQNLDPTSSLTEALRDFEAVLSADQKHIYRSNYAKPVAGDVVALISRVDADNKGRARQCFAGRLCTLLEGTVQFTSVVDTFVSSNPSIAALVWGSLKTVIIVSSNVASYFDKVTNMIMEIGRTCPTYEQFGRLYPSSKGLQIALCKYFAIVVRVCTKVLLNSKRSSIAQFATPIFTPFETEFQSFRNELVSVNKEIKLQISLAAKQVDLEVAKLVVFESRQNSAHRNLVQRFQDSTNNELIELRRRSEVRETAQLRSEILICLSTINHTKSWKEIKSRLLLGTAEWFKQDSNYLQWRDQEQNATLWCSGKLGFGKSVLVSNVVSHLLANREPSTMILYHFCRFDQPDSLLARNIIGSLCKQSFVGRLESMNAERLRSLQTRSRDGDMKAVLQLLSESIAETASTYIVIDGLDECEDHEVRSCIDMVAKLRQLKSSRVKILYATRPELEAKFSKDREATYRVTLAGKELNKDICCFIQSVLDTYLQDGRLRLGDPTLIETIVNALVDGAEGMFLWTKLLIDEICSHGSDRDIIDALDKLPRSLTELFRRKIDRVKSEPQALNAMKTLQYCGIVRRPLNLNELLECLSFEVSDKQWDRQRIPNDGLRILEACHGLVSIDEEDFTVRYVHHSVRHHLFHDSQLPMFEEDSQNLQFGLLCLTYLNFPDFDGRIAKISQPSILRLAPLEIGLSGITESSEKSSAIARFLLKRARRSKSSSGTEISVNMQNFTDSKDERMETVLAEIQFPFLQYAENHCIYHLKDLSQEEDAKHWSDFRNHINGLRTHSIITWEDDSVDTRYEWALQNDHGALYVILLESETVQAYLSSDFTKLFLDGILSGKRRILKILSGKTASRQRLRSFSESEICSILALSGSPQYLDITQNLMSNVRRDPGTHTQYVHMAIAQALLNAQADVLSELLIGYAARPDPSSIKMQSTCLYLAILLGNLGMVQSLKDTDKTLPSPNGLILPIPLGLKVDLGSGVRSQTHPVTQGMCFTLLPNPNVSYEPRFIYGADVFVTTPLVAAVLWNEIEILKLLIQAIDFYDAKAHHLQMALEAAIIMSNEKACKIILGIPIHVMSNEMAYKIILGTPAHLTARNMVGMASTSPISAKILFCDHLSALAKEFVTQRHGETYTEDLNPCNMVEHARRNVTDIFESHLNNINALEYIATSQYRRDTLKSYWKALVPVEVIDWLPREIREKMEISDSLARRSSDRDTASIPVLPRIYIS